MKFLTLVSPSLETGMVLTDEPGIYLDEVIMASCIEDVCRRQGCEVFSRPKELIVI